MSQVQLRQQDLSDQRRPILELNDLTVAFRKVRGIMSSTSSIFTAVDHVSFEIFESEFISLVGESGSGKTTIARCITLLTNPSSGTIAYKGSDITKMKGKDLVNYRREVQIVYQDPFESLNPRQDVFSIVSAPIKHLLGEKNKSVLMNEVSDLLREVGLDPLIVLHKYPHQLSGGERQRINIARAFAAKPKLLIADEPVTMLDATQRFNVLSLLMKLKETRNLTVLMITHDLPSAQLVSDRTFVVYLGKIVEQGFTRDVIQHPHHPYVELIMSSIPKPNWLSEQAGAKQGRGIEESIGMLRGCSFTPRCKYSLPICKNDEPSLQEKTPKHFAACHNPINVEKNNP
ncbi:MAG: oligopeptide/dipeptide ABC transporter ATP-binding protein [Nitrososphaerales archaeon]